MGDPIAIESTSLNLKIPLFGRCKKVLKVDERLTVDEYHTACLPREAEVQKQRTDVRRSAGGVSPSQKGGSPSQLGLNQISAPNNSREGILPTVPLLKFLFLCYAFVLVSIGSLSEWEKPKYKNNGRMSVETSNISPSQQGNKLLQLLSLLALPF